MRTKVSAIGRLLLFGRAGAGSSTIINPVPASDNYEDLSTYTLVDEHTNLTVDVTKLTAVSYPYEHAESYLYKDFGAAYFKKNFVINFDLLVSALTFAYGVGGLLVVTDTLGDLYDVGQGNAGPAVELSYESDHATLYEIWTGDYSVASNTHLHDVHTLGIQYYCTLTRTYGAGDTSMVKLGVYTDVTRTILAGGTAPYGREDLVEAVGAKTYRYLLVAPAGHDSHDATNLASFVIDHIEIISNAD